MPHRFDGYSKQRLNLRNGRQPGGPVSLRLSLTGLQTDAGAVHAQNVEDKSWSHLHRYIPTRAVPVDADSS